MTDYNLILPRELPDAATAATNGAIPLDDGSAVVKVTPKKIVDAGRPFASQSQAEAGTDATVAMSPLTTKQAIEAVVPAVVQPFVDLAEAWAESPTPPDPGIPTSKSAKTWAIESEASATSSADSADLAAALTSESPQSWADFSRFEGYADGKVVSFNGVQFVRDRSANISGLGAGAGWRWLGNYVTPHHFGAAGDGVADDSTAIQAALNVNPLSADPMMAPNVRLLPGEYVINSDITILNRRGSFSAGGGVGKLYEVDFSGTRFSGAGRLIVDSSKGLKVIGYTHVTGDVCLRGLWYGVFDQCCFSRLILGDVAGASYTENYWNAFETCVIQQVITEAGTPGGNNAFFFYNCGFRGTSGSAQGFPNTLTNCFVFNADTITQGWKLYGGDISYYDDGVIDISAGATREISIYFDGVYIDREIPTQVDRDKTYISTNECVIGGFEDIGVSLPAATTGDLGYRIETQSFDHVWTGVRNLLVGGSMGTNYPSYAGSGRLFQAVNGATITRQVGSGLMGQYLNAVQANSGAVGANLLNFRTIAPSDGRYSVGMLVRCPSGPRSFRLNVFDLRYPVITIGSDWTFIPWSLPTKISAGSSLNLSIYSSDGDAFELDFGYVGIFLGPRPSLGAPEADPIKLYRAYSPTIPELTPGASWTEGYTATGYEPNDFVRVSMSGSHAGLSVSAAVESSGVITLRVTNIGTTNRTPGARTFRVEIDPTHRV